MVERGSIKLDGSKTPIWIDLIIIEGDDANKTQLGVLQIHSDTITGKLNTLGSPGAPQGTSSPSMAPSCSWPRSGTQGDRR